MFKSRAAAGDEIAVPTLGSTLASDRADGAARPANVHLRIAGGLHCLLSILELTSFATWTLYGLNGDLEAGTLAGLGAAMLLNAFVGLAVALGQRGLASSVLLLFSLLGLLTFPFGTALGSYTIYAVYGLEPRAEHPRVQAGAPLRFRDASRARRAALIVPNLIFGLLGLPWPFAVLMSSFLFDSPVLSSWERVARFSIFFSILAYPALVIVSMLLSWASLRRGRSAATIFAAGCLPLLSAVAPGIVVVLYSLVT